MTAPSQTTYSLTLVWLWRRTMGVLAAMVVCWRMMRFVDYDFDSNRCAGLLYRMI